MGDGAMKIYTKGGDKGKTSLIGGKRVSKAHARLDAYGTIDELNSVVGLLAHEINADLTKSGCEKDSPELLKELALIQSDLFDMGSHLACEDATMRSQLPTLDPSRVTSLEKAMDAFSAELKPLKHFVLPGGARSACVAHMARTICRRAERLIVRLEETEPDSVESINVQYLNRLSDYFFVLARHLNRLMNVEEPIWLGKDRS